MNLDDLLKNITERQIKAERIYSMLQGRRTGGAYGTSGRLDLTAGAFQGQEQDLQRQAAQEAFVFRYYLLQLREMTPANDEESEKIKKGLKDVHTTLTQLSQLFNVVFDETIPTEILKQKQKDNSQFLLLNGARNNDEELVDAALAGGADVNFISLDDAALTLSVEKGNLAIATKLVAAGADVNIVMGRVSPRTPLMAAVGGNQFDMVKLLMANGANVNHYVQGEGTALYVACNSNVSFEIIQFLLTCDQINVNLEVYIHGETRNALYSALYRARMTHDYRVVQSLADAKVVIKDYDFRCAVDVDVEAVSILIKTGFVVTADLLSYAIQYGSADTIDLLVSSANAPLAEAKEILKKQYGYTDLSFAVAISNEEEVKHLIAVAGQNVDEATFLVSEASTDRSNSALIKAAKLGRASMVSLLLSAGAQVDVGDEWGQTPLMLAASQGHLVTVQLLLAAQADVNKSWNSSPYQTALFLATKAQHADVVEILLNVESVDTSRRIDTFAIPTTINQLGLQSANKKIAEVYQLYNSKPLIVSLKQKLTEKIGHFRENGKSHFGIGNNKKANRIEAAMQRAVASREAQLSRSDFLNYKEGGQESIAEALAHHRIRLFGIGENKLSKAEREINNFVSSKFKR